MIFTPFKINGKEFKNRLIMSALNTGFVFNNEFSDKVSEFYKKRAKGGAAAITTICAVNREGSFNNMPFNGEGFDVFCNKMSNMLNEYECKHIVQLFHYGSGSTFQGEKREEFIPKNMSVEDIKNIVESFKNTSKISVENGADALEIEAGKGFLLSEFISPLTNNRDDQYGGSFDNRINIVFDVMKSVREAVGAKIPVILSVSGAQMTEGGYTVSDMAKLCEKAEKEGLINAVKVSGGWYNSKVPCETYFVPFETIGAVADTIKRSVNIPVITEGRLNSVTMGEKMIENTMTDFLAIGKSFLADPDIAIKILGKKTYNVCQGCNKCIESIMRGDELYCSYNPEAGLEYMENTHRRIATAKKIVVVGGGPAGMMAAKKSAERGYKTILITNESRLGGQLNMAGLPPKKDDIFRFIKNLENDLKALDVNIVYNTFADFEKIKSYEPYFVVLAMGSVPVVPDIFKDKKYILAKDVFFGSNKVIENIKRGKTVIIGGGSLGLELAEFINDKCCICDENIDVLSKYTDIPLSNMYKKPDITIIEKLPLLGFELNSTRETVINGLLNNDVKMFTDTEVIEVKENSIVLSNDKEIEYDNIIIATGSEPVSSTIAEELMNERISYSIIGDSDYVRDAEKALKDGFELFLRMFIA